MNEEKLKKYAPVAFVAAIILGGIYYLRRNTAASGSASNTGYSVVNPPDNSAAVAAASAANQARFQLAGTGLSALTQLTALNMTNTAKLAADAQAQNSQITLAHIQSDNEMHLISSQLDAARIQSDYNLRSQESQNAAAIAIQTERDTAAINMHTLDTGVQNNAVAAQASVQKHRDNSSTIMSAVSTIAMIAMFAFCYEDTDNAHVNRRVYGHQEPTHQFPGGQISPREIHHSSITGIAWRGREIHG